MFSQIIIVALPILFFPLLTVSYKADVVSDSVYLIPTWDNATVEEADQSIFYLEVYFNNRTAIKDQITVGYLSHECHKCSYTYLQYSDAYFVNTRYYYDLIFKVQVWGNLTDLSTQETSVNRSCTIPDVKFLDGAQYWQTLTWTDDVTGITLDCSRPFKASGHTKDEVLALIYGWGYAAVWLMFFFLFRTLHKKGYLYAILPGGNSTSAALLQQLGDVDSDVSFGATVSTETLRAMRPFVGVGDSNETAANDTQNNNGQQFNRMKSIDLFRGISIIAMIFVNYGGGGFWYFNHSPWNGLTLADLVFPWFVFVMGVSIGLIMFSTNGNEIKLKIRMKLFKIWRRSIVLFFIGLTISNPDVLADKIRIMGVLQRLAISYCFVATMTLVTARFFPRANLALLSRRMGSLETPHWTHWFLDIEPFWVEWVIMGLLTTAWVLITFLVYDEDNNCPRGYLGPGGLQYDENYNLTKCTGGAAGYIDRTVFGYDHTYQTPTAQTVFGLNVLPFDPEGLLGCLTSILLTFLGLQAGRILFVYKTWTQVSLRLVIWIIVTGLLGGALCQFSADNGVIPINKNLWSLSFVLVNASVANLLLLLCYLAVDILGFWDGAPFTYAGMNSLLLYMGHEVLDGYFPFCWGIQYPSHLVLMFENITACALWIIIALVCYKRQLFIKV